MNSTKDNKITPLAKRSACPITNVLDLLGDKWTLVIIRDMTFLNKTLFGEFLQSMEGVSTNILTDRLKRLEAAGVISKQAYQENPIRYRYHLTERGKDLKPLLLEFIRWGNEHIEGTHKPSAADLSGT